MIRVRRHSRQLASGKTAKVRQHDRNVQVRPREERDAEWRGSQHEPAPPGSEDDPEGTVYFRKDDEIFAVHPDGTVYPAGAGGEDGDEPEGTMYLRSGDDVLAVHPDGTARNLGGEL